MFFLDELDKILDQVDLKHEEKKKRKKQQSEAVRSGQSPPNVQKGRSPKSPQSITLEPIKRIDVEQLNLKPPKLAPLSPKTLLEATSQLTKVDSGDGEPPQDELELELQSVLSERDNRPTLDFLFAKMLKSLVFDKLDSRNVEAPKWPLARLVICDKESYDAIMKLQYITTSAERSATKTKNSKNLIYRRPYEVTAVLLLHDIIELIDFTRRPFVVIRDDTRHAGRQVGNYDYSIIKQIFPFLKLSNLIVMLSDVRHLKLYTFSLRAKREHQVLQYLTHFARSTQLIELEPIHKLIGRQHLFYDNVSILKPEEAASSHHLKPPLAHLSKLTAQLIQVVAKLGLSIQSITYRANDPNGYAKIFSQTFASSLKRNADLFSSSSSTNSSRANVLVLDRFADLQGLFRHTERYGAFIEQELLAEEEQTTCGGGDKREAQDESNSQQESASSFAAIKLRMDSIDDLDKQLQLVLLTEALDTILKHTTNLKLPRQREKPSLAAGQNQFDSLSGTMSASKSIRRHLDIIKLVYKALNEGYLLLLKLEASLDEVVFAARRTTTKQQATGEQQAAERIVRVFATLKQLAKLSSKSSAIKAANLLRVACILIEAINMFCRANGKQRGPSKKLLEAKAALISGQEIVVPSNLNKRLKEKVPFLGTSKAKESWANKLAAFDRLSESTCGQREHLPIKKILDKFLNKQLDVEAYPTVSALEKASPSAQNDVPSATTIFVFLGSLSFGELAEIKDLENELLRNKPKRRRGKLAASSPPQTTEQILVLTCNLIKPADFLSSL